MTDDGTTYDQQGLGVHLTGERSQNGAQRLAGYQPDVRPDAGWPGLSGAAGEVRAKPEEMHRVAGWLEERSGTVQSLPAWLSSGTSVSFGPPTWHEANHLKEASATVTAAVSKFVAEIAVNMGQASASIRTAGGTYTATETANSAGFDAVDGRLPSGGASGAPSGGPSSGAASSGAASSGAASSGGGGSSW